MTADNDNDRLRKAVEQAIPSSLGDIVRIGCDTSSIGLASEDDLARLAGTVPAGRARDTIDGWYLVTLRIRGTGSELVETWALGWARAAGVVWITSPVAVLDLPGKRLRTKNSVYGLGEAGSGEPDIELRLHLCYALRTWGLGKALGVPEVFY